MRFPILLASALLFATPAFASAPSHDAHAHEAHAAGTVAHSHQAVVGKGLKATFHFNAPHKAAYTCSMHPEVVSAKPGECAKCGGMKLVKQTHHIAVQLADAKGKPVQGAMVRLVVKDAKGMVQALNLTGNGYYEGSFHLMPGKQQLTAFVKPKGAAQAVDLATTYQVK
jgi:hypothetical protein